MKLRLITEDQENPSVETWDFDYSKGTDPRPKILFIGMWRNPKTSRNLICGFNLNYLTIQNIQDIMSTVGDMPVNYGTREKVQRIRRKYEYIFQKAYRTYDADSSERIKRRVLNRPLNIPL